MLDREMKRLEEGREAGRIPPFNAGPSENAEGNDPLSDRLMRSMLSRRARMRKDRQNRKSSQNQ